MPASLLTVGFALCTRRARSTQILSLTVCVEAVEAGVEAVEAVEALLDRRSDGPPPRDRSRLARHRSALEKIGTPNPDVTWIGYAPEEQPELTTRGWCYGLELRSG